MTLKATFRLRLLLCVAAVSACLVDGCGRPADYEEVWSRPADGSGVFSVAAADLNGDGYSDLLIGTARGAVAYFGSAQGLSRKPDWSFQIPALGSYGFCVGSAGHMSADPHPVIFVSAPRFQGRGAVFLFRTGPKGPEAEPWKVLLSPAKGEGFGERVVAAGDLFGDGYDDLAVADFSFGQQTGKVYVYRGGPQGPGLKPGWSALGEKPGDWFGYSLCAPGDLDGDGLADLVVGSKNCNGSCLLWLQNNPDLVLHQDYVQSQAWLRAGQQASAGRLSVFFGAKKGLSAQPDLVIDGSSAHEMFAYEMAPAGDVEGRAGILVGSIGWQDKRGLLQLFVGGPKRDLHPVWRESGGHAGEGLGFKQTLVANFSAPGAQDLITDGLDVDEDWLYRPFDRSPQMRKTHLWPEPPLKLRFSQNMGSAGDIYGDGRSEIFLMVPGKPGRLVVMRWKDQGREN